MKLLTATIIIGLAVGYGYGRFAEWRFKRNCASAYRRLAAWHKEHGDG